MRYSLIIQFTVKTKIYPSSRLLFCPSDTVCLSCFFLPCYFLKINLSKKKWVPPGYGVLRALVVYDRLPKPSDGYSVHSHGTAGVPHHNIVTHAQHISPAWPLHRALVLHNRGFFQSGVSVPSYRPGSHLPAASSSPLPPDRRLQSYPFFLCFAHSCFGGSSPRCQRPRRPLALLPRHALRPHG